jgi:hypothetical protein
MDHIAEFGSALNATLQKTHTCFKNLPFPTDKGNASFKKASM